MATTEILKLRRAVFDLIELAKAHGLEDHLTVRASKELIRCRVQQCGMAGACNADALGKCPIRDVEIET